MTNIRFSVVSVFLISISGCATVLQGTSDTIKIEPSSEIKESVNCDITTKNHKENWVYVGEPKIFKLSRSNSDLIVNCESKNRKGYAVIAPRFQKDWLIANASTDLCLISCPIDYFTGSFFDYPNHVIIKMKYK